MHYKNRLEYIFTTQNKNEIKAWRISIAQPNGILFNIPQPSSHDFNICNLEALIFICKGVKAHESCLI